MCTLTLNIAIFFYNRCIFTPPYYTCVSGGNLISFDIASDVLKLLTKPLTNFVPVGSPGM